MRNRPRLAITCGRCGKRADGHPARLRVATAGAQGHAQTADHVREVPDVQEAITNPLTHVCMAKSGFKRAKSRAAKRAKERAREKARKKRQAEQHPFESCRDDQCKRPQCVAYRTGWHEGEAAGFESGFESGFSAGLAACPGPQQRIGDAPCSSRSCERVLLGLAVLARLRPCSCSSSPRWSCRKCSG